MSVSFKQIAELALVPGKLETVYNRDFPHDYDMCDDAITQRRVLHAIAALAVVTISAIVCKDERISTVATGMIIPLVFGVAVTSYFLFENVQMIACLSMLQQGVPLPMPQGQQIRQVRRVYFEDV